MKYEVIQSIAGSTWYIYKGKYRRAAVSLGMFPTREECKEFADKLCDLLNAETNPFLEL